MPRITLLGLLLAVTAGFGLRGAAQQTMPGEPPATVDSLDGHAMFGLFCAPCHGRDAKGGGPVGAALKTRPPDLTDIARRNRGVFPKARVEAFVTNGNVGAKSAHGTSEMPVWGPNFKSLDPNDTRVRVRIGNIVDYVESLQTELTMVSGNLEHHLLTNDLFHIDDLWMQVAPNTEFHRWLSQGINRNVTILLVLNADRFADAKGVRILTGHLVHDIAPAASPIVHELFLKDPATGAVSAITFETTDAAIAKAFDFHDDGEVSLIIQIK
jgi:mono/diheme cytochrome c family protein